MTAYFCDGLKEVTFLNGVVRLEFHRLQGGDRPGARDLQPTTEVLVALPTQAFMQALELLDQVRQGLTKEDAPRSAQGPTEGAETPPRRSPNFA